MKKHDVGWFGIKPFASNSLFKGTSKPGDPHDEEDNRIARLAIRYILCNPAITAPIPGLITVQQVDNVALAVRSGANWTEEKADSERAMDRAGPPCPYHYQWLKDWEYVCEVAACRPTMPCNAVQLPPAPMLTDRKTSYDETSFSGRGAIGGGCRRRVSAAWAADQETIAYPAAAAEG